MANPSRSALTVVGWREWLAMPELGVNSIKAKLDTGAKTSALHAFDIQKFRKRGREYVRFTVHPWQRNVEDSVLAEAPLLGYRAVRSSSGHEVLRPVIRTEVELFAQRWRIELTLANRDQMGFRMLLGREALRKRFLVDSGASFRAGRTTTPQSEPD